jgi:hypothetical protein
VIIHVDLSSSDPRVAPILRQIDELPAHTSARAECEGALYLALARVCWRDADRLRAAETRQTAKTTRRAET